MKKAGVERKTISPRIVAQGQAGGRNPARGQSTKLRSQTWTAVG